MKSGFCCCLIFAKMEKIHYESESVGKTQMRILPGGQTPGCDLCDLLPQPPSQTASGLMLETTDSNV